MATGFSAWLDAADRELSIDVAASGARVRDAQRLRHTVYCRERGYEPGRDGLERDAYDGPARHVIARSRATGEALGTVRLVLAGVVAGFPLARLCDAHTLSHLPAGETAEISRFAIPHARPGVSRLAAAGVRLALMRGIVAVSEECGLTHWCAMMESSLLRLLGWSGIHFDAMGGPVEHRGIRHPVSACAAGLLARLAREQREVWQFVTKEID